MNIKWMALILLGLTISACHSLKNKKQKEKLLEVYLPFACSDLAFGMSFKEALERHPKLTPINYVTDAFSFRKEFSETIKKDGVEHIIYYFDTEGNRPLYEAIIYYKDSLVRDSVANLLFGPPNHEEGTEWLYNTSSGFQIQAWKHRERLVVIGLLPGTEWSDEPMDVE